MYVSIGELSYLGYAKTWRCLDTIFKCWFDGFGECSIIGFIGTFRIRACGYDFIHLVYVDIFHVPVLRKFPLLQTLIRIDYKY